jgi:type IV secretion system protein VirB1
MEVGMKNNLSTNTKLTLIACALLCFIVSGIAQTERKEKPNAPLGPNEFKALAQQCAPDVPVVTLRAIARAESSFHPYALSLNYPKRTAQEQGLRGEGMFLSRQPRTLYEARAWTRYLVNRGRSVSIGLLQVNSEHAASLGLTWDQLFDPCTNVRVGARLLTAYYRQAAAVLGDGQEALQYALSGYNSGFPIVGFTNGYVDAVIRGEFTAKSQPVPDPGEGAK